MLNFNKKQNDKEKESPWEPGIPFCIYDI